MIFLFFCTKLGDYICSNVTEPVFPRKLRLSRFGAKGGQIPILIKKKQQMALRRTFLRIGSKDFFDIVHEVRGLYFLKSD